MYLAREDDYCQRKALWRPASIPMNPDWWFCKQHAKQIAQEEGTYGVYRQGGEVEEIPPAASVALMTTGRESSMTPDEAADLAAREAVTPPESTSSALPDDVLLALATNVMVLMVTRHGDVTSADVVDKVLRSLDACGYDVVKR